MDIFFRAFADSETNVTNVVRQKNPEHWRFFLTSAENK